MRRTPDAPKNLVGLSCEPKKDQGPASMRTKLNGGIKLSYLVSYIFTNVERTLR